MLRKGWTVRRLWILSIIGAAGLGLDIVFHTLDSGTPLTIIFDGAEFNGLQMITDSPAWILTLSWVGHIAFLTAFSMLIIMPRLFFEKTPSNMGPRWAMLKEGKTVRKMWYIALIGATGMALDIAFHWSQDGSPDQVLLNGFDNAFPLNILALVAHILFVTAFTMLMFLPKILFADYKTTAPIAK